MNRRKLLDSTSSICYNCQEPKSALAIVSASVRTSGAADKELRNTTKGREEVGVRAHRRLVGRSSQVCLLAYQPSQNVPLPLKKDIFHTTLILTKKMRNESSKSLYLSKLEILIITVKLTVSTEANPR